MEAVKFIFEERVSEIDRYFSFLKGANGEDKDLNKILRSNLILMLYNLIESSISNAIEAIHNNIYLSGISFNDLNIGFKKILVQQIKSQNPNDFVNRINDLATDVIKYSFNKNKISNGNIDNKTISELGSKYGFCIKTNFAKTQSGVHLKAIKNRRNDLAHGVYSFTEIGKEYTIEDLDEMKSKTICYIEEILSNIDQFLTRKNYHSSVD